MAQRPVIVDCDPGQDDAVALLMALASPESLKVLGITCVAGNVPLELTQRNARRICELAGQPDLPVFAGCPRPMLLPLPTAEAVHGKTGLDGSEDRTDSRTASIRESAMGATEFAPRNDSRSSSISLSSSRTSKSLDSNRGSPLA